MLFPRSGGCRWRWFAVSLATACGSFYFGCSPHFARLLAQCGQSCVGGCLLISGDGMYLEYDYCTTGGFNTFFNEQAVLCLDDNAQAPGPNVQPVQAGFKNQADLNAAPTQLPCQTLRSQEASTSGNPTVLIPQTICPHE